MLKIVDVHAARRVQGEYVVLENQGLATVSLRGCALCTDAYFDGDSSALAASLYVFREDVAIKPYMRVVLFTGQGEDGWVPTIDGRQAYCAYWGRSERVWSHAECVHVLHLSATRRLAQPTNSPVPVLA